LVNRPAVILADEPSGSLDSKNKEDLNRLFFDLRKNFNQTLLIVTHDKELGSLDSKNKEDLNRLFFDLRKNFNQTLLIVTHDKELASIADRMINIKDGVIEQND
jgi:ABC-type lipoprotein export system ATPase subunit